MNTIVQDLRHAIRALRKRPGYSLVVISTLALAIGANSAIFTVVNAVLLQPLPYPEPERLVQVSTTLRRDTTELRGFSYPDFEDVHAQTRSFSHLAAYAASPVTVSGAGEPERILGERVTDEYFGALSIDAALGRTLTPGLRDGEHEVVIGDGLWTRRFARDRRVLGTTLHVAGEARVVVGVMPPGFVGLSDQAEIWLPLSSLPPRALESRSGRFLDTVGRLRDDVDIREAKDELATIAARLETAYPDDNRGYGATVMSLQDRILGDFRKPLVLLAAAVGFVLLIGCTNIANLLLTRASARTYESAVRAALGASRLRLVRHFIVEILVLSVLGGAAGLALASWSIRMLQLLIPIALPSFVHLQVDTRVLAFTSGLALVVGMLLGVSSTWRVLGGEGFDALTGRGARSSQGTGQRRIRGTLVVAEVALALMLLIGAGLMMESFQRLQQLDAGFDDERIVFFRFDFGERELGGPAIAGIGRDLRERLSAVVGVEQLALASDTPLEGVSRAQTVTNDRMQPDPTAPWDGAVRVYWHRVSDGFFSTLGIPLVRGREFRSDDQRVPATTVIVSARLASRLWPGADPIGQRLRFGSPGEDADSEEWMTVVGVAGDVRYRSLLPDSIDSPDDPDIYLPLEGYGNLSVAIRTAIAPAAIYDDVRRTVSAFDKRYAVFGLTTIEERLGYELARSRFSSILMTAFALLALLLSGIGVYGVMSHSVGQRTREIGIRMALGAERSCVLTSVVGEGMRLVLSGSVIGLVGAIVMTRYLASLLHETSALDPVVYAAMTIMLSAVAFLACWLPARRASRVEPVVALRQE